MTNNPGKVEGLRRAGIEVSSTRPLPTSHHNRNGNYLRTKERRLGHTRPAGPRVEEIVSPPSTTAVDVSALIGDVRYGHDRPYVVVKFAQSVDGRIATANGDAKWISGDAERRVPHGMRAASDVILVGVNTVILDDPQLTVRMTPGASPVRVVLDSFLRIPATSRSSTPERPRGSLRPSAPIPGGATSCGRGVEVDVVAEGPGGVDLQLRLQRYAGRCRVRACRGRVWIITSILAAGLVDRLVVAIAPIVIGEGVEAVGPLGVTRVGDGIKLVNGSIHPVGEDVLLAWDVVPRRDD